MNKYMPKVGDKIKVTPSDYFKRCGYIEYTGTVTKLMDGTGFFVVEASHEHDGHVYTSKNAYHRDDAGKNFEVINQ